MVTPYEIAIGGKPFWLVDKPQTRLDYLREHAEDQGNIPPKRLGLVAIGAFRRQPEVDYVAVCQLGKEEGQESWTRVYEEYEWLDWMAGAVYRDPQRQKELLRTERSLGRFVNKHGWAPDYILETAPGQDEIDGYIAHVVGKDERDGVLVLPAEDNNDAA